MTSLKRPRGRPKGSGIDDRPTLEAVADMLFRAPHLRATTAMKRVALRAGESDIRRLQGKWRADEVALREGARLRAEARKAADGRDRSRGGGELRWSKPERRAVGVNWTRETATEKAMRQFMESPINKALERMANDPVMKAIDRMANNPTLKALERLANNPTLQAIERMTKDPTLRAMERMREQQETLHRFNEQQEAIARLMRRP